MTITAPRPDLDHYVGKLQPQFESRGQADIGHMLDNYLIPFFYKGPLLICENGQRKVRRPAFTLPTYNNLVLEYSASDRQAVDRKESHVQGTIYRENGIDALFLGPWDLTGPDWQQRLYERLEEIYHRPRAGLSQEYSPRRR
jgi:hypothetical protein